MYWLGIDIGTGGSRALLVGPEGKIAGSYTAEHQEMRMERPLWAEQDPLDWWKAAQEAIRGVLGQAGADGKQIEGIGLSGQMHGLVILDADGEVLRPSLIWCDQRSQAQVDWINQTAGREMVLDWTANPVLTGFTLPKLLWVRDHEPEVFKKVRKILLPKDYVRYRLTGRYASDVSDASGTSLFDVVRRQWSAEMAQAVGIGAELLPNVYESADLTGQVSEEAARETGLRSGIPVVGGAGDQAASAIGNGIVQPGLVSCTVGTSGVVFAHMEEVDYDPQGRVHTFCHAVRGAWHVMGVTQGAGLSLQWFRNHLGTGASYDDLTAAARQAPAGSRGLYWLPYLMGERTPHLDSSCRGGWIGLTASHGRPELIRSLLEGVTYSLKDCLRPIEDLDVRVESVRLSGGGARSEFWQQLFADTLGYPVTLLETQEGSAYGAALLALAGTGVYPTVQDACRAVIQETARREPGPAAQFYQRGYQVYRSLYPALQPFYRQVQDLET